MPQILPGQREAVRLQADYSPSTTTLPVDTAPAVLSLYHTHAVHGYANGDAASAQLPRPFDVALDSISGAIFVVRMPAAHTHTLN